MFNYLIVGSGLFGAVFAHEAKKAGNEYLCQTFGNCLCRI